MPKRPEKITTQSHASIPMCSVPGVALTPSPAPQYLDDGGNKNDAGKLRLDLLPFDALESVAQVMAWGAAEHGDCNWELGMSSRRVFAAASRHLWSWFKGEDFDKASGLPHLAHCATNVLFLLAYQLRPCLSRNDDRPHTMRVDG